MEQIIQKYLQKGEFKKAFFILENVIKLIRIILKFYTILRKFYRAKVKLMRQKKYMKN